MKAAEIRNYSDEELKKLLLEKKKQLMDMRFQHAMGQLRNTAQIKEVRRDIARIRTILRERELGIRR
ncbi:MULTISPECIES: 50S ribosomal protein L29 [Pseudothermotoga]|jgi:large subunit ribosomal protein L29|uniref:Large ribosomal subunit protein uL29 n=1 Tax=Pseudothermotoga lettingae (strain ATCC BAA-301 / DSM 14385 / NBRC 107922 / TMO) TaxID=416591 RepID=RL29_PSELT|nr:MULTISPECIES: 50S ribosomal protein L29 [Pseudothermotoga]A8F4R9.1 RecName: Full=Large ribosomal subunit protein uL29; AltName: Full=50S ribosomal protein L29 [Pseudothermotoga lettingae TMO]ABV33153.1 ribosomal protein L29 [Pseudothermotoga lettingae TMO]KUK21644.1 MAG: 50S ribosomal protein L29 [Pseudothermotoga lettingae]MDI3494420.1 large subunit ribosomal protein [Pseudothermotoga sp.]MDK2884159.1 large subunit ribosomal protein [Pseudothermotoga sp.]GLI47845.1 50S ribosomal protein L